jgi:DNA-binding CsgD family transcriptional regulator
MPEIALRPIERVVLRLNGEGLSPADIGKKVRKKPGTVHRIIEMSEFKKDGISTSTPNDHPLRPVERVVMKLRDRGETYGQIGNRLALSGRRVQFIERLAEYKLSP